MKNLYFFIHNIFIQENQHLVYLCIYKVAEVLAHLHVQISPISCNGVGSILCVLGKNTDTAINCRLPPNQKFIVEPSLISTFFCWDPFINDVDYRL